MLLHSLSCVARVAVAGFYTAHQPMGRGGQKAQAGAKLSASSESGKTFKGAWTDLPIEVLRKKAKQFGEDDSGDRDALLAVLVSEAAAEQDHKPG